MPWLEKCMTWLPATLNSIGKLKVLVFLSSIAILENNNYVCYTALEALLKDLSLNMAWMQELLLLSKYILSFKWWRLHDTIPTRVAPVAAAGSSLLTQPAKKPRLEEKEEDTEDVQAVEDIEKLLAQVIKMFTKLQILK